MGRIASFGELDKIDAMLPAGSGRSERDARPIGPSRGGVQLVDASAGIHDDDVLMEVAYLPTYTVQQ